MRDSTRLTGRRREKYRKVKKDMHEEIRKKNI